MAAVLTRPAAVERARLLNRVTIGWNLGEAGVALVAGAIAGSIGLVGFGLDSVVEVSASLLLAWRLAQEGRVDCTQASDRRATRGIAVCFAALAAYVGVEAVRQLVSGDRPDASLVGICLAAASLVVMPALARAKSRLAPALGSRAQAAEARQTNLCAWLSAVLLVGLGANALWGWWWADPAGALVIAGVAGREALSSWRAESLADTCCG